MGKIAASIVWLAAAILACTGVTVHNAFQRSDTVPTSFLMFGSLVFFVAGIVLFIGDRKPN
jgi:hypothetical protein